MRTVGNIISGIGAALFILGGLCLDSEGAWHMITYSAAWAGLALAVTGGVMVSVFQKGKEDR